jgi:hypothetical protein
VLASVAGVAACQVNVVPKGVLLAVIVVRLTVVAGQPFAKVVVLSIGALGAATIVTVLAASAEQEALVAFRTFKVYVPAVNPENVGLDW